MAQMRDRVAPYDLAAVVRRENTDIGTLTILGHGALSELGFMVVSTNTIILPIFILLTLTSLVVAPWIVRRSLAGVSRIAREAEGIDADSRGRRLSEAYVPQEIAPLVLAVNDACAASTTDTNASRGSSRRPHTSCARPSPFWRARSMRPRARQSVPWRSIVDGSATMTEQLLDLHRLENNRQDEAIDPARLASALSEIARHRQRRFHLA